MTETSGALTPVPLLIVDDHQMLVDGLVSLLRDEARYPVAGTANNGRQAYDLIAADPQRYGLLLADISMPLLTGIQLCRMVKSAHPHIQVLMLSMYDSQTSVKEAVLAEADGYILKNTSRDELLTALHRVAAGGTYFSQDVLPILYGQFQKEKAQQQERAVLSTRELEVLTLIVREKTSEEIAADLFIAKKTVDNHRANILEKTGCRSTIGLVKWALKAGLE